MASSPAGRSVARLLSAAALTLAVAACGTISATAPPATPTDFPGITGRLSAAGISVGDFVSGDAGCEDPDLVKSAISLQAGGLDQAAPVKLYLYVFRDRAAFERHRAQVGPCAQAWVTDPATYEEIEQSPFVLAGQGPWGTAFEAALRSVMLQAAGTGG
jgi:hypothetical protein